MKWTKEVVSFRTYSSLINLFSQFVAFDERLAPRLVATTENLLCFQTV